MALYRWRNEFKTFQLHCLENKDTQLLPTKAIRKVCECGWESVHLFLVSSNAWSSICLFALHRSRKRFQFAQLHYFRLSKIQWISYNFDFRCERRRSTFAKRPKMECTLHKALRADEQHSNSLEKRKHLSIFYIDFNVTESWQNIQHDRLKWNCAVRNSIEVNTNRFLCS